ncbi:hypothetical protein O7627_30625 [Solwaraspora sp. WMMD1047]|uniref:hypothetical protein n=1 Tax=Solwaraspora sp. WMMD1047 TaxID=3016102 RepID=UPI0024161250|nr:hypothetical protein [Solwaraspora sp. WMMD1047]MDG4833632.1 hypothetical protein [Solwaraspora sp. WMMD1047]
MPDKQLSAPARQALIALMINVNEASNPQLHERFRFKIEKSVRNELADAKLIEWRAGFRGTIFHTLTPKGWERGGTVAAEPLPPQVTALARLLYGWVDMFSRHLARTGVRFEDALRAIEHPATDDTQAAPAGVEERVLAVYHELAGNPGDLVSLARVRRRLADVERPVLDAALKAMDRDRRIHLEPETNRKALEPEAREAAISIGGEDKHLITSGRS